MAGELVAIAAHPHESFSAARELEAELRAAVRGEVRVSATVTVGAQLARDPGV